MRYLLAVLLSITTVYAQLRELNHISSLRTAAIGLKPARHFLETEQTTRHEAVLRGAAGDPWQYRILPDMLIEGAHGAAPHIALARIFIGFRFLQNVAIFLLFDALLRRLSVRPIMTMAGMGLLAYALGFANYNSGLSFDTYFDVAFYLLAGIVILDRREGWLPPLAFVAALNRETSLLIPVLILGAPDVPGKRALRIFAIAAALQLGVLVSLRLLLGPQLPVGAEGHTAGWDILTYNVGRPVTWLNLLLMFGAVPFVAATRWRHVDPILRRWFWLVVPVWLVVHLAGALVAETRLMLVPLALILLPAALQAAQSDVLNGPGRSPSDSALPAGGRVGSRS